MGIPRRLFALLGYRVLEVHHITGVGAENVIANDSERAGKIQTISEFG